MEFPPVTLAFISWNRLHYLRATLESARLCIDYPNLEWIVSDNNSAEPGLRSYINSRDWIGQKWFKTQTHAEAMNEIVERATGKYVLIWPEDVQFVVRGHWLRDLISTLEANPEIGSVVINFLRHRTLRRIFGPSKWVAWRHAGGDLLHRKARFRFQREVQGPNGFYLRTAGWMLPGVVGSGIPSLTRRSTWKQLGQWKTARGEACLIDSSLGAEDDMILQFDQSGLALQQAMMMRPVAADIINDSMGSKAKVRKGNRYGNYTAPLKGDFYYEISDAPNFPAHEEGYPLSFEHFVKPCGFELPLDASGHLLKASMNTEPVVHVG